MKPPDDPPKPLKILTIDGGGLRAISTLLIIDKLLNTIAQTNGVPDRKPRPCDVFDTIAGIGAGGWLALLLGRFHMDITTCLSEWYKITQCITPRSKAQEMRMRVFQHCYFDTDSLVEQIDQMTKVYGTGECLFSDDTDGVRTRHVFVAALRSDSKEYNLFRSYEIPEWAKMPNKLRRGPEKPDQFKISSAFGVTGASRYFTPPWKEQMEGGGKMRFSDSKFPKPHNITELALDEMWCLYGTDVPLSIVVNVGPGPPNTSDVRKMARRFSWGLTSPVNYSTFAKRPRSPTVESGSLSKKRSIILPKVRKNEGTTEKPSVRFGDITSKRHSVSTPVEPAHLVARSTTFGSIKDRRFDEKLRRLESDIELDVKKKLDKMYPGGATLYYRLAPDQAAPGTSQNDSAASGVALDDTDAYLSQPLIEDKLDRVAHRLVAVAG